jgi:hypothetical protein
VPLARGRLAIAVVVALGIIGATVFLVPSWESASPVSAPTGAPAAGAPARASGAPAARGGSGGGSGGGGGGGGGASSSGAPGDANGLNPATKAVSATVVAGVHAVAPGTVDHVLVADSDPSWAVAHVAPSSGNHGLFILVHYTGGWYEVESGYPQMPCDEAIPAGVQADLGLLMASCG